MTSLVLEMMLGTTPDVRKHYKKSLFISTWDQNSGTHPVVLKGDTRLESRTNGTA